MAIYATKQRTNLEKSIHYTLLEKENYVVGAKASLWPLEEEVWKFGFQLGKADPKEWESEKHLPEKKVYGNPPANAVIDECTWITLKKAKEIWNDKLYDERQYIRALKIYEEIILNNELYNSIGNSIKPNNGTMQSIAKEIFYIFRRDSTILELWTC